MRREVIVGWVAVSLATGCGGSTGPSTQLQIRAARICLRADRRLARIGTPNLGPADERFLERGVAVLVPELRRLRRLHPQGDARPVYGAALSATAQEIIELQRAVGALAHQQDPVRAFASLQRRLRPLENQANRAWSALQIPACITR